MIATLPIAAQRISPGGRQWFIRGFGPYCSAASIEKKAMYCQAAKMRCMFSRMMLQSANLLMFDIQPTTLIGIDKRTKQWHERFPVVPSFYLAQDHELINSGHRY